MDMSIPQQKTLSEDEWVFVISGMLAQLKHWLRNVRLSSLIREDKLVVSMGEKVEYIARITERTALQPHMCSRELTLEVFKKLNMIAGMCDSTRDGNHYVWGVDRDLCWYLITIESTHLTGLENTASKIIFDYTGVEKLITGGYCKPQTLVDGINRFCTETIEHKTKTLADFTACADDLKVLSDKCIQNLPNPNIEIKSQRCQVKTSGIERGRFFQNIANDKIQILTNKELDNVLFTVFETFLTEKEKVCLECATIYTNDCPVCKSKRRADEKTKE
jgi:hypothetical protein